MLIADDLDKLLAILPQFVYQPLQKHTKRKYLIEVVMDLGRRPEARFPDGPEYLSNHLISWHDLDFCIKKIGNFSGDNRSGIECTLHRISSIRNRKGNIVGLTCRVGRAIFGTISIIRDLLESSQSILLLGKPGVGKTTAIREMARVLADEMEKRVVIIDTSNEIAGDGDIPHPAIGRARRMQVARPELQHQVMIEAVENHMPEVIIIDEIGTELEALAARTIAERGVQLVGTAHGNYLESLIKNPTLSDLIGGIQYVTLGDDEAKRRGSQKSIIERKALPAFQVAIEIHKRDKWIVHEKVEKSVDQILQGSLCFIQSRQLNKDQSISIECENYQSQDFVVHNQINHNSKKCKSLKTTESIKFFNRNNNLLEKEVSPVISVFTNPFFTKNSIRNITLYPYALNLQQIEATINRLKFPISLTRDIIKADIILALRSNIKHNAKLRQIAKSRHIIIYTIHCNSITNIVRACRQMLNTVKMSNLQWKYLYWGKSMIEQKALLEVRLAVEKIVRNKKQSVELLPQLTKIRKIQYSLIKIYQVKFVCCGEEPNKFLRIYPY
uniref:R3H domain-containing protein n=1 Tax=Callithamnion tetricum TaxID=193179 RepID=A0A4D6WNV4_9FLOR|nr:hypothetical protein [Callithamnion tetricum]